MFRFIRTSSNLFLVFKKSILCNKSQRLYNFYSSFHKYQLKPPFVNKVPVVFASTGLLSTLSFLLFNRDDDLILAVKKGILAQMRGQFKVAEENFHDALHLYERMKEKNEIYKVNIYLYLANLYYLNHEWDKSFRIFQECLRQLITKFNYSQNNEAIVEISLKMSNILAFQSNEHDAKVGYEFCVNAILSRIKELETIQTSDGFNEDLFNAKVLYAMILHTYGRYLTTLLDNKHAVDLLEQAKVLGVQLFDDQTNETALEKINNYTSVDFISGRYQQLGSVINDLALAYYGLKDYNQAAELLKTAIEYYRKEEEILKKELSSEKQAKLKMKDEDFDRKQHVEQINQQKFELDEHKLISLSNLCSTYFALNKYANAKDYCMQAKDIYKNDNKSLRTDTIQTEINEIEKLLKDINDKLK